MYRFDQGNLQTVPEYGSEMEKDNARLELEMKRLQASNAYSMADQENRAKMEAQLIAMKAGFLPADMAQGLIGVPQYNAEQSQVSGGASADLGTIGGIAGGVGGFIANQQFGAGLSKAGAGLEAAGSFGNAAQSGLNRGSQALKQNTVSTINALRGKSENKIFQDLLTKSGQGSMKTAFGMRSLGEKLAGKGSTKAASSVLGKLGGKVAGKALIGGAIGGIPGFLIGTAIGTAIEKLMQGNEKDQAKAQFMLSQYQQ